MHFSAKGEQRWYVKAIMFLALHKYKNFIW